MLPIAVLVSGTGSNLQAILDASRADPDFGAQVVVVISDRAGVGALERAARAGVPSEVIAFGDFPDRTAFTEAVGDAAEKHDAEALVLAGFMRVLDRKALERFPERILNVHPSLLPAFPGARPVRDALRHGVKVTGVTVHLVDEEVDHGPIIAQRVVEVVPGDSEATLYARIQAEEHRLYPQVVKALAHRRLRVEGRLVTWEGSLEFPPPLGEAQGGGDR